MSPNLNSQIYLEMYRAAYHGNSELVNILLQYSPQINITDMEGNTPIMLSEKQNYTEIGDKEFKIALQLEKMGYIQYKTEIEDKLKTQKERIVIYNQLKLYS